MTPKKKLLDCLNQLNPSVDVSQSDLQNVRQYLQNLDDDHICIYDDELPCHRNFIRNFLWPRDPDIQAFVRVKRALYKKELLCP